MKIRSEDLYFADDGLAMHLGTPFSGTAESFDELGGLSSTADYANGILHGYTCDYCEGQQVLRDGYYCQGQSHGWYRFFDEDGALVEKQCYDHAILVERQLISSDGSAVKTYDIASEPERVEMQRKIHLYLIATKHECLERQCHE
jgi:hypothetical protein